MVSQGIDVNEDVVGVCVSHLKQRPGFTEHKVSYVELKPNFSQKEGLRRRQGLTECKVSQKAKSHKGVQHYEERQGLRKGRVLQKAKPHRSQGPTEGKTSQRVSQKGRASQKAGSGPLNKEQQAGVSQKAGGVPKPSLGYREHAYHI